MVKVTILRLSDKKAIEANDAFPRWFGLRRESIVGHDFEELGISVKTGGTVEPRPGAGSKMSQW